MSFNIKKLNNKDINLAKSLFHSFQIDDGVKNPTSSSDDYLKKLLSRDDFYVLVAIENKTVIGGLVAYELVSYKDEESEIYLYELGVQKSHRRKGIATSLIDFLKEICIQKEIEEMVVGALADNLPAVKLYEKTGGIPAEVVEFTYEID